ncbi:hypothetical protein CDAR_450691 [Caerostris darwini]|uniref:Transposase n=1 Tax=Caerostris darwini TaxID=1538125 RepID=A0AAV4P824_9ARAC|nr:hypothetical protein CDAR_450691 [Caerostris darwini]
MENERYLTILIDKFDLTISETLFRDEYDGYSYISAVQERTNRVNRGIEYCHSTMKVECYNVMCEAYQILYTKLMFHIIKEILDNMCIKTHRAVKLGYFRMKMYDLK